ncbi:MAG: adenosylcobalamin-dependent ribonucleoside-diphosphate reductase [Candidatus Geothermarchaeales archaeon]
MFEGISSSLNLIRKRDGRVVQFLPEKIASAINRSALEVGVSDPELVERISRQVVSGLERQWKAGKPPSVEEVQDMVENVLIANGLATIAKAYILYRQKRSEVRRKKREILEKEDVDEVDKVFDINALRVLKSRYLRRNEQGRLIESPKQLFTRVAIHAALPEMLYDPRVYDKAGQSESSREAASDEAASLRVGSYQLNRYHVEALRRMHERLAGERKMRMSWRGFLDMMRREAFDQYEEVITRFYELMVTRSFLPNTPALANFGNPLGMGSACFVLDIDDSMESIMDTLKQAAHIFKSGGGVGYNFSKLRPEGDFVSSTSGIASGPVSFIRLFDVMTEVIKQGGIRRGANMGILNINHPDIEAFITAKEGNKNLTNFNISVLITPDFWEHYRAGEPYPLINPRTGRVVRMVNPGLLLDRIVYQAWESAEPGVMFEDNVNRFNPFSDELGPIITTNPCGEVLLYPNESCNLGSVNVWSFTRKVNGTVSLDWESLADAVRSATRFLDNVVDVNSYPLKEIEEMTLKTRKIGLGVMGLANLLCEMRIPYDSKEARDLMERLMEFINYHSKRESIRLARERGAFPYFKRSFYAKGRLPFRGYEDSKEWRMDWHSVVSEMMTHGLRNGYTTVIAPTGSISMIAGCSSGIEPIYSLVYEKHVKVGEFHYTDPVFEQAMREAGLYSVELIKEVAKLRGRVRHADSIPTDIREAFVTAHDMSPEDHIRALASFQKWVDSSISKTTNFPADATVDDMRETYLLAYSLGCKDVTVFRDGSISEQVLRPPTPEGETASQLRYSSLQDG